MNKFINIIKYKKLKLQQLDKFMQTRLINDAAGSNHHANSHSSQYCLDLLK